MPPEINQAAFCLSMIVVSAVVAVIVVMVLVIENQKGRKK